MQSTSVMKHRGSVQGRVGTGTGSGPGVEQVITASSEGEGGSCNEAAKQVGEMGVMVPDDLVWQVGLGIRHA